MNSATSLLDHCSAAHISAQRQLASDVQTDSLAVDEHVQHSTKGIDSRSEPNPSTCQNLLKSTVSVTASDLFVSQRVKSDVINGDCSTDAVIISSEVTCQQLDGQQLSAEGPRQQHCDVTSDQHPASASAPPSDQSGVVCRDWKFFAARRVDVPLLLDILLARIHRDLAAREFLLSLPASTLRKYEIFSRQNPLFVCLDIVK